MSTRKGLGQTALDQLDDSPHGFIPIPSAPPPKAAPGTDTQRSVIEVFNPATAEKIGEVPSATEAEAAEMVRRARAAQPGWAKLSLQMRCAILGRFADQLTDRAEEVADLIVRENGKTRGEALVMEVISLIDLTRYFAKNAQRILKPKPIKLHLVKSRRSYLHYKPRGVVLVISPWNFPMAIPGGEIVMSLIAGNAVIQKPASLTPLIALKMRELMDRAGVPANVFQVCTAAGRIGSSMIEMGVDYVNFTGSTGVGKRVAELCGKNLIPCTMELGGKDPAIVLEDANLELAANAITWGAFCNSGQVCASVERVYVHQNVYEPLKYMIVERTRRLRQGDPRRDDVDVGAMTDKGQLEIVARQVEDAREKGAEILVGGVRPEGPGQFYPPTVIAGLDETVEVAREESFGPVLPIMKVADDEEAIRRANDSIYGLNAYVFSGDKERGRKVAERLEAGSVCVNEGLLTYGMPETPWGGVKESGVGRTHGDDGLRELCIAYHVNEENLIRQPSNNPLFWYPYGRSQYMRLLGSLELLFKRSLSGRLAGLKKLILGR